MLLASLVDRMNRVRNDGRVPTEEAVEVDGRSEKVRQVGARLLVVRPYELGRDVGLVLNDLGVENHRGLLWRSMHRHGLGSEFCKQERERWFVSDRRGGRA